MVEYTFAMVKPDAVSALNSGKIIDLIEKNGFDILRMHKIHLTPEAATEFYEAHAQKPFFGELVAFICQGPVVILALGKENAIKEWRELMGATDSKKAAAGTVRALYGTDVCQNAVHGSDSPEAAERELSMFFIDEDEDETEFEEEDEISICEDEKCEQDENCCKN
jgi:nucleoside-diphosphate kinase